MLGHRQLCAVLRHAGTVNLTLLQLRRFHWSVPSTHAWRTPQTVLLLKERAFLETCLQELRAEK
jgi:hypothetical protein